MQGTCQNNKTDFRNESTERAAQTLRNEIFARTNCAARLRLDSAQFFH
jgi:hypothetical protein